jgi:hypothetical protein
VAVFGGKPVGVGIHIQHPGEQRARAVQLAHRPAVGGGGGAIAQQLRPGKGGVSGDIEQIFHRVGNACQRGQRLFSRRRVSIFSASASMRFSLTWVQALICGLTRAMFSRVWRAISLALSSPRPARAGFRESSFQAASCFIDSGDFDAIVEGKASSGPAMAAMRLNCT